jgi:uncharacterized protein (TIGR02246 family)
MHSVESTIRAYFEALNGSDVDGILGVFDEEGTFMMDEAETVAGHDELRRAFQGAFGARAFERELHVDEIREADDLASARTHTTGTITLLPSNDVLSVGGRELFVLRRADDGWRITDAMLNRPTRA